MQGSAVVRGFASVVAPRWARSAARHDAMPVARSARAVCPPRLQPTGRRSVARPVVRQPVRPGRRVVGTRRRGRIPWPVVVASPVGRASRVAPIVAAHGAARSAATAAVGVGLQVHRSAVVGVGRAPTSVGAVVRAAPATSVGAAGPAARAAVVGVVVGRARARRVVVGAGSRPPCSCTAARAARR